MSNLPLPEELTTALVAQQLGISCATLMKTIARGEIPAHRVGADHRLNTSDIEAFKKGRLQRQHEAMDDLWAVDDELDGYGP